MKTILRVLAVLIGSLTSPALAQTNPGWSLGYVPPPSEWNNNWASKYDLPTTAVLSASGTTQGTAAAITTRQTVVTPVALGSGVVLPALTSANETVVNRGVNVLNVYPPSGAKIETLSTNAPFLIPSGAQATFVCSTNTQCYTSVSPAPAPTLTSIMPWGSVQGSLNLMKQNPAPAAAPGAAVATIAVVAGTTAGTCKLIVFAGTSTTPTTLLDNIGGGC